MKQLLRRAENSDGASQHDPSVRELIFMVRVIIDEYFNLYRKSPVLDFNSELE